MFWVLLALCLLPLYVRGSFSALLRKVEKRLSDSRKSTEGQELPAYAKHLSMRPTSHPFPRNPPPLTRGGMEPCWANPQAEPSVLSEWLLQPQQETLPGRTGQYPGDGNDQHFPREAACSEEKTPLLCTKLQGCLARLRGVFLNFSQLL